MSVFDKIPVAPEDPVFGLSARFKADPHPSKMNLGVGAYRDEEAQPWVLPVVRAVEQQLAADLKQNKEYLDISGLKEFCDLSASLILGKEFFDKNKARVATCQGISGTGAVRLGAEFLGKYWPVKVVYSSNPTWGNHKAIFNNAGVKYEEYRYWNPKTLGLDLAGMLEDLEKAPEGAIILLHACAHNPTGVDPTLDEWKQIAATIRRKKHLAFFDSAYQGFASGDLAKDATAVRFFAAEGFEFLVAQSFAKNFGLYAERAGNLAVLCGSGEAAVAVASQLKQVVRPMYSNPPKHGALIVATVLGNAQLFAQWAENLQSMAGRIKAMRDGLFAALQERKVPGDWSHIIKQIGMFSYTGLTEPQCRRLVEEFHIYLLSSGRISMAGVTKKTIPYLADCIQKVVTETPKL